MVKNLPANAGAAGSIPGPRKSPGEGNGNPLQYSHLGNPVNRGAWQATVHGSQKCWKQLRDWTVKKPSFTKTPRGSPRTQGFRRAPGGRMTARPRPSPLKVWSLRRSPETHSTAAVLPSRFVQPVTCVPAPGPLPWLFPLPLCFS